MDSKQPTSYFFIGSSSGKDVDGDLQVDRIEGLLDPSASHKSLHIDQPPGLIGLEDPSQVPFEWEDMPVHKVNILCSSVFESPLCCHMTSF